jgi:hypothetical protein
MVNAASGFPLFRSYKLESSRSNTKMKRIPHPLTFDKKYAAATFINVWYVNYLQFENYCVLRLEVVHKT